MKKIKQLKLLKQTNSFISIKKELDALLENKTTRFSIRLSLSLLALIIILIAVFWGKLPPQLPLFYSKTWGKDQLASKWWFLTLPFICFLIVILDLRLASLFLKKEEWLAKILVWTAVILALLVSTTIIRVLLIIL